MSFPSPRGLTVFRGLSPPRFPSRARLKSPVDLLSSFLRLWRNDATVSSRRARSPPLLAGGPAAVSSPPYPVGVVSPVRSRVFRPRSGGSGGFPFPRRCASLPCAWGGPPRPRPPVSPRRIRRCGCAPRPSRPWRVSRRERVCLAAARRGCRRVSTGGLPGSAPAVARPPGPRFITPVVARGEVAFRAGDRRRSLLLPPARATHPAPRPVWATVPALPMPRGRGVWGREAWRVSGSRWFRSPARPGALRVRTGAGPPLGWSGRSRSRSARSAPFGRARVRPPTPALPRLSLSPPRPFPASLALPTWLILPVAYACLKD